MTDPDLSPMRGLLAAAEGGDDPTTADKARVRSALAGKLAVGVAAGAAAGATAKAVAAKGATAAGASLAGGASATGGAVVGTSLAAKVLGAVLVVGTVAGGVATLRETPTPTAPASAASPPAARAAHAARATTPASPQAPVAAATLDVPAAPTESPTAAKVDLEPSPRAAARPADQAKRVEPLHGPAERASEPRDVRPITRAPSTSTLEAETRLLRSAQVALDSGDAALALSLLDEHKATFPTGALAEERRAQRIFALCAAQRTADAKREAATFLSERPSSPLAPRVRASCAGR